MSKLESFIEYVEGRRKLLKRGKKWWHDRTQEYFNSVNRQRKWPHSRELFDRIDHYFSSKACLENEREDIIIDFIDKE